MAFFNVAERFVVPTGGKAEPRLKGRLAVPAPCLHCRCYLLFIDCGPRFHCNRSKRSEQRTSRGLFAGTEVEEFRGVSFSLHGGARGLATHYLAARDWRRTFARRDVRWLVTLRFLRGLLLLIEQQNFKATEASKVSKGRARRSPTEPMKRSVRKSLSFGRVPPATRR